jgi:glycosyltransferase involved in cell wall biosynthesis
MRVGLLVYDVLGGGGVPLIARLEAEALVSAGHEVVCPSISKGDLTGMTVITVRNLVPGGPLRHAARDLSYAVGAARHLPPVDLVVAHGAGYGWVAAAVGRRYRCPSVAVIHALCWDRLVTGANPYSRADTLFYRLSDALALRSVDYTINVSEHMHRVALAHGATRAHALVRRNPVDTRLFQPSPATTRDIDALYVGRLTAEKGPQLFVEAIRELPGVRAVIAGQGPLQPSLERRATRGVQFVGAVDHGALPDLYRRAKLCVVPSYAESFGLVILEAFASGTPVIGAHTGGIPELIEEGVNGWLFEPGDVKGLAMLLRDALERDLDEERSSARVTAERHSLEAFRLQVRDQYEAIYRGDKIDAY